MALIKARFRTVVTIGSLLAGVLGCGPTDLEGSDDSVETTASALAFTPGIVKWSTTIGGKVIPVCWMKAGTYPFGGVARTWTNEKLNMADALAKTWARVANIRFNWSSSTCPTTGSANFIRVSLLGKTAGGGSDGFGWDGGTARKPWGVDTLRPPVPWNPMNPIAGDSVNIVLRQDNLVETTTGRMRAIAVHEFGHVLGFLHEQARDDNNGQCPADDPIITNATKLTPFDRVSIMSECAPQDRFTLTASDVLGVRKTYGYRNAGDMVVGDQWRDLLWRNRTNGQIVHWGMAGNLALSASTQGTITVAGTAWTVVGTGDFNHDGESDLVWHNRTAGIAQLWLMQGVTPLPFPAPFGTGLATDWYMRAVGDFDADGHPDVVWQHPASGQSTMWLMRDGVRVSAPAAFATGTGSDWKIVGAGDFNGDGKDDLVWNNKVAGRAQVTYMNGNSITEWTTPFTNIAAGWELQAVGDYDGDQVPDFVWSHTPSGQRSMWFMTSATVIKSTPPIFATVGTDWDIVGP